MTRILVVALLISGCKDNKPKAEATPAGSATPAAVETNSAGSATAPAADAASAAEATPATGCDPDKLKDEGMEHINKGEHAQALEKFEASLACKDDAYVVQLAFMESCSSKNSDKAKLYYKKLSPPQQQKFQQMCIRVNVAFQ
jgi:hypothetical protein